MELEIKVCSTDKELECNSIYALPTSTSCCLMNAWPAYRVATIWSFKATNPGRFIKLGIHVAGSPKYFLIPHYIFYRQIEFWRGLPKKTYLEMVIFTSPHGKLRRKNCVTHLKDYFLMNWQTVKINVAVVLQRMTCYDWYISCSRI